MRKLGFPAMLVIISVALSLAAPRERALAAPPENVLAHSAVLLEVNSGNVLYEKNMRDRRSPDNLVKVMLLLAVARAYENGDVGLDDTVSVDESAWQGLGSAAGSGLSPGEQIKFLDLLYLAYFGINDAACNAVAAFVAGSVAQFVDMMNAEAYALGCADTKFANTHGGIDSEQYTTAWDLAVILKEACSHSLFVQVAGEFSTTLAATNYNDRRDIRSPNYILGATSKYYYSDATTARASGTYESGYGVTASARRDDISLVAVILGASAVILEDQSTQMQNLTECVRLFEWGFNNFSWRNVLSTGELIAQAPVRYADGADSVLLRPSNSIELLLANDIGEDEFTRVITIYAVRDGETLMAPVDKGAILGEVTVFLNGENCGTAMLVANTGVELQRLRYLEEQVLLALGSKWVKFSVFLLVILFSVYAALVIRYNKLRRERIRKINEAKQRIIDERKSDERDFDEYTRF
jgi:D-alanyl-D-alanine carboxypeptidase (penicillin-binding protein 5/6)